MNNLNFKTEGLVTTKNAQNECDVHAREIPGAVAIRDKDRDVAPSCQIS